MSDSITKQTERVEALYQLSLSIGNSLDLHQMLAESGTAFFEQLAAYSLGVYQRVAIGNGRFQLQEQYTKGRIKRNAAYHTALEQAEALLEQGADTLAFVNQHENSHQYGFDLPDYGVMIVLKKGDPLSAEEIGEKRPLFRKLAIAAAACHVEHLELTRLAVAVEQSLDGTAVVDLEGNIQFVNPAWAEMHGYQVGELIGQPLAVFHTQEQLQNEIEPFNQKIFETGSNQGEVGHKHKDGTTFPTWMAVALLKNEDGVSTGLVASIQDITERKHAREQLQLQNYALESALEGIVITKIDGTIQWVNAAFTTLTGYTFEEAVGGDPSVLKSGEHDPDFYKDLWDTILDGRVWQKEVINRRKDGSLYTDEMTITPVRTTGDEITHFVAVKRDVTERKQARETLKASEKRYRTLFNAAADAIELVSAEGILVDCNDVYLQALGYERDEAIGQHVTKFFTAEGTDLFKRMYPVLRKEGYVEAETDLVRKDGSLIKVWRKARATYDDDGEMTGVVVYNRDITERQRIEAAIEAHVANLQAVADVSTTISAILDVKVLLQVVSDTIKDHFGYYHAHIFLMNDDGDTMVLTAGAGEAGKMLVAEQHQIALDHPHSIVAESARIKSGVIVNDVRTRPDYMTNPYLPKTQAEMAIPIILGNHVLGVMDIQSDKIDYFSREDRNIQTTLASQIAVALQNAEQYRETQEALAETEALLAITKTASGTLDLEVVLDDVLVQVLAVTGFESGLFSILNTETDSLDLQAYRLPEKWAAVLGASGGLDGTLCDLVYRDNRPIVLGNLAENAPIDVTSILAQGYKAYQGVPMQAHGNVLGTLCLFSTEVLTGRDAEAEWLAAVGSQIGFAIQNARLFEQSEAAVAELDVLTRRLTREGWDSYLDTQDQALSFVYDSGAGIDAEAETGMVAYDHPLLVYGEKIGNLALFSHDDDEEWDAETTEIIMAVTAQLTARIENLRLTDETQRALSATEAQAKRLTAINQVAQAVSQESDVDKMLEVAYKQIQAIMPVDTFFVGLYNDELNLFTMVSNFEGGQRRENTSPIILTPETSSYQVLQTGRPLLQHLTPEEASQQEQSGALIIGDISQHPSVSKLFVPLQAGTKRLGVLSCQSDQFNMYRESDMELLEGIANYVAVALENIRLFSETEERAEQLASINRVARIISEQLDLEHVLEAVYKQLAYILPVDFFFINFYDEETDTIEYPLIFDGDHRSSLPASPVLDTSNTRKVINGGNPILLHMTREEAETILKEFILGDHLKESTKSQLFVPMQSGQNILGVLSVQSYQFDVYTQSDVDLVMGIAQYLAIAIENVRLFTDTQMRAAQLEKLSEIEGALSQARSESEVIQALALFSDDDQAITLHYVEESDDETPIYAYTVAHWENGEYHPDDPYLMKPFLIEQHAGTTIGLNHPNQVTFIADIEQDDRMNMEATEEARHIGYGAVAIVPMRSAGRWQGFVSLKWPQAHQFTADELFLWRQLREPVGSVVAGRRAFMAQQGTLRETEALYEAGEKLNAAATYDEVLDVIREYTVVGSGSQNISLNYFSEAWVGDDIPEEVYVLARRTAVSTEDSFQHIASNYHLRDFPSAHHLLKVDEPSLVEDVSTDPRFDENTRALYMNVFKAISTIFVPLVAGGQWFGYISAIYHQKTTFSDDEVRRLMVLAGQAAVSIQSIHLLDVTTRRAEREQTLRQITERVRGSASVETVLQTAVQELSRALGRRAFIQLTPDKAGEA